MRDTDSLTKKELVVVLSMVSIVNSKDEDDKTYERPVQEWYDLLGIQGFDSDLQ